MALSFTEYDILSVPHFSGLDNYARAFFDDKLFCPSLGRTFLYAGVVVPTSLAGSLLLAILLNQKLLGTNIFRTIFFVPHLTPIVAVAVICPGYSIPTWVRSAASAGAPWSVLQCLPRTPDAQCWT